MIELELRFDGIVVDNIYVNSIDDALDIIEHHSYKFEDQNESIKKDWIEKMGGDENVIVDICYAKHIKKRCPRCHGYLYPPDIREYDYTCYDCDENFYECEVK